MQGPPPGYAQPLSTASSPSITPPPHRGPDSRHALAHLGGPVPEPGHAPFTLYPSTAGHPSSTFRGPMTPRGEVARPTSRSQYASWSPQAPGPQRAPDWQYGQLRHPPGPQRLPGPQHVPESRSRSAPSLTSATPDTSAAHHPPVTNHRAPVTHPTVATGDASVPQQSENKDAGTGEQAADGADGAGAAKPSTPKHILDKEKQARAAIRKLKEKFSIDGQMGESITMVRTNTGVEFSGTMWKAPANDTSIPTTEVEIKACVDALDTAMHNVVNIREKADVKSSNNRWNSKSKYYFPEEYNAAAGLLVKELIKIHTDGWTKQIFDSNEREQCQLTQFYTFEDRFEGLRELLHYSKTSCQDIMKGSRFYTIIANPRNLIHRTATNKTANVNKGNQIKAGKKVMKQESSTTTSPGGDDKNDKAKQQDSEEGSNSEESTKVKKASRGKKRAREETFVAEDPAGQPPRKKAPVKKRSGA
ncbi:uncharacterized protein J4E79_005941 [Alternaria viburni]|uniref:uncharacterized protein n=1 Tax=Alternaria viburni TaxID=566460 RepID=UPI0020C3FB70|nr:uncharacterized protein J4E79_005941 [Alternaria viburni]KAI4660136.1 hypothetical protein J4E79_005941 [Alternaria viburni]